MTSPEPSPTAIPKIVMPPSPGNSVASFLPRPRERPLKEPRLARALAFLLLLVLARPAGAGTVAQVIAGYGFAPDEVGFILTDPQSGDVLAARSPDRLFLPASVTKLATSFAAEAIL